MVSSAVDSLGQVRAMILKRRRSQGGAEGEGLVSDLRDALDICEIHPHMFWGAYGQLAAEVCIETDADFGFRKIYRLTETSNRVRNSTSV